MNHIPMHIDHDRNMDWVSTQVRDSHLKDLGITIKRVGGHRPKPCLVSWTRLSGHHVGKGVTEAGQLCLKKAGLALPSGAQSHAPL